MNKATILVSAVLGIFLGTSIGIAQASSNTVPVTTPVEVPAAHVEVTENVILMNEVTITVPKKSLHAVNRVPSKPAKQWTCQVENLQMESGSPVRYCFWK